MIEETLGTLKRALTDEIIITFVVIVIFLLHFRSSIVVASTLPLAVIISFIIMYYFSVDSNVMSLAGIAIAIGTMVDMGIIMTENIYSHLSESDGTKPRLEIIYEAGKEVGGANITAVSTHFGGIMADWGEYEPAIRRWEAVTRPAPPPPEPNKNGKPRLPAEVDEGMMGLPQGGITDLDIPYGAKIKLCGNGVVPQQAELALRLLLSP